MKKFSAVQYLFVQSFETIFLLLSLQSGPNLRSASSTKAFAFEWKNLVFQFDGRCSSCNYFCQPYKGLQVQVPISSASADLLHACRARGD